MKEVRRNVKSKEGDMSLFKKELNVVERDKRRQKVEKLKTMTLVAIFSLAVGIGVGFKLNESLQSKYSKVPTVQVVQAQADQTVQQSK